MSAQPLWLTRFALTRPVTICMLFLSLLVFGIIASRMLPLEKFPGIDIPQIFINVPYNNATPTEIERLITRPVEEALATVTGVKEMRSWSNENNAEISLEFNWEENINSKSIEVRERLDSIRQLLPDDVERVLVFLDSNHTHDHVAAELELYAPLASKGSYCVVFDTVIEDMPKDLFKDRPWGPGDNPKTAVWKFVDRHPGFVIDRAIHNKLLTTVAPDGFLRREQ